MNILNEEYEKQVKQICNKHNLKYISKIGQTGAASICFLAENQNKEQQVIKIPLSKGNLKRKAEAVNQINEMIKDYNGNLIVPKTEIKEDYCIEPYCGEDINLKILPYEEQVKIAEEVGEFLAYLHEKGKGEKSDYSITRCTCSNIKKMKETYLQSMPEEYKNFINELILDVKNFDHADEVQTWCHGDVRFQNLLYNTSTKKAAIIDFDNFGCGNIYDDFIPAAPASQGFSAEFLKIMIDAHNKNCKYQIDKQKFVAILKLAKLDELARCAMADNKNAQQFLNVLKQRNFMEECKQLDNLFIENSIRV